MRDKGLPVTEELDFSYLLGLMRPLYEVDGFAWLPELFTLVGHERLIELCRYAGGETITIPTLDQLSNSIEALQVFYDIQINNKRDYRDGKYSDEILSLVLKIKEIYDARDSQEVS